MAKAKETMMDSMKMNRVRPGTNVSFNIIFTLLAAAADSCEEAVWNRTRSFWRFLSAPTER